MVTTRRRAAEAAAPASPSPAALAAKHGLSPLRTRLALAYHLAVRSVGVVAASSR